MVLYHAISVYQILMVSTHFLKYHSKEYGVLILPDFITDKFEHYDRILSVFNEVYLFPYTKIPHDKKNIFKNVQEAYLKTIPYGLECFQKIYVAGAHFYFSFLLISYQRVFYVFEDACGMLSQSQRLYCNLFKTYPIHAEIMNEIGMFDLNNKLIKKIYCNKKKNGIHFFARKIKNWDTVKVFEKLKNEEKEKIVYFFTNKKVNYDFKDSILLITQNFVGLGSMNVEQQKKVYVKLKEKLKKYGKIVVKIHPDDKFDYSNIFGNAKIIKEKIPVEILLLSSPNKPEFIFAFSSASDINKKIYNVYILSEKYKWLYSHNEEYRSIMTILNLKEKIYE